MSDIFGFLAIVTLGASVSWLTFALAMRLRKQNSTEITIGDVQFGAVLFLITAALLAFLSTL